jgi:hypothetical protein
MVIEYENKEVTTTVKFKEEEYERNWRKKKDKGE